MAASYEPGAELPELKVTPDRFITVRYAGASADFNPIHIDEEFARSVGLPGRILHGLWSMAQVARAQTEAAGGPEKLKALVRPVPRDGRLEQEVVVTSTSRRSRTASRPSRPRRARATRASCATRSRDRAGLTRRTDGDARCMTSPVRRPAERAQAACADAVRRTAARLRRAGAALSFGQDPRWRAALVARCRSAPATACSTSRPAPAWSPRRSCARTAARWSALDQSAEMLGGLRARLRARPGAGARIEPSDGEAERLPFADAEFDALTFTYLLRYVDDPPRRCASWRAW